MSTMHELRSRRWNPGFIALRWRHLFWGLPLLGALVGLAVSAFDILKEKTVVGSLLYLPLEEGRAESMSDEELAGEGSALILSDRILESAVARLDLEKKWRMDASACASLLRREAGAVPDAPEVELSMTSRNEEEAMELWKGLRDAAWEVSNRDFIEQKRVRLDEARGKVVQLERELMDAQQALDTARIGAPAPLEVPLLSPDRAGTELEAIQARLEHARTESEQVEASQHSCIPLGAWSGDGHPSPASPRPPFGPMVMLGIRTLLGCGWGMFAALLLAYLLELLVPRKTGNVD